MVRHRTQDPGVDNGSTRIGPDEWNDPHAFEMICTLGKYATNGNSPASYDALPESKGLGIALVDMTYVTYLQFGVFYLKATANIDWQLWDHLNGVEIAMFNDSGAQGDKVVDSGVIDVSGMGLTGLMLFRLRARAINNTGQTFTYYGGYLRAGRA